MTVLTADPQSIVFEELDSDMTPPCELITFGTSCGPAPAKWVMHMACPECGITGIRLACDACKELRMSMGPHVSVECPNGHKIHPPRKAYQRIEAL